MSEFKNSIRSESGIVMSDNESENLYPPGTLVRLKSDPGRQGVLTGKVRVQAGISKYQIAFPEGKTYQPEYELEVVEDDSSDWEYLIEQERFGLVRDLRRSLTHIHLNGRLANLVYSMDATNTDFYAYQYKPVLSFLDSPSKGLLIADEVGLGKTIEAGLIWTELRARYDARRLLVLCPAMLREKWCSELSNRFGVDAEIMTADEALRHLQKDKHSVVDGKGIVCSLQGLRPPAGWKDHDKNSASAKLARFLDEQASEEPLVDLVIVDEAHYLRNPDSQTAKLGQLLRGVADNVVLLSATPINLSNDDLFHLLNIVDPDSFRVKEVFPQVLAANEHLQKARVLALDIRSNACAIGEELALAKTNPLLKKSRQLEELANSDLVKTLIESKAGRIQLANRIEKVNLLRHAISRTRKAEVTEWRVVREPIKCFIELDKEGPEWEFYQAVTETVRRYAWESDISDGFLLAGPQRQVSSCMYGAAVAWRDKAKEFDEQLYEDFGHEGAEYEISPLLERLRKEVLPNVDLDLLRNSDSKYKKFRDTVLVYLSENKEEKIIVFSFYRRTLFYLSERLLEDGIISQVLVGGMRESKDEVILKFREDKKIRILLSSEVASEGVDLQFCRTLFNYDLPWNPMKVEQRIGRIDRIGQTAEKISIVNLLFTDTIDHKIHERLYSRLNIFERALGGMEAILGEEISHLTSDLLSKPLTAEQEQKRIEQTAMAVERIRHDQEQLEQQASHLIAHGGYILDQVQAAHQFKKRITEQDLVAYVKDYLDKHCQGFEFRQYSEDEYLFDIRLPASSAADLAEFIKKNKLSGQTRLATGEAVRCLFANKVRDPKKKVEVVSQFHPIIRFIGQQLNEMNEVFHQLVSIKVAASEQISISQGVYAFFINRWEFAGIKLEEDLPVRAVEIETGKLLDREQSWSLLNIARVQGADWLEVTSVIDMELFREAIIKCGEALEIDFQMESIQRKNENFDRVAFQIESAVRHRDRHLSSRLETLKTYRETGKSRMIPATEGMIRKIKERFDVQEETLKRKSQLKSSNTDVCCGVILVQ